MQTQGTNDAQKALELGHESEISPPPRSYLSLALYLVVVGCWGGGRVLAVATEAVREFDDLAKTLVRGELVYPGDAAYPAAIRTWNAQVKKRYTSFQPLLSHLFS
jgi:hypothetical protein